MKQSFVKKYDKSYYYVILMVENLRQNPGQYTFCGLISRSAGTLFMNFIVYILQFKNQKRHYLLISFLKKITLNRKMKTLHLGLFY